MKDNVLIAAPFLLLALFLGFVGGMETSANMTGPIIGAILCLVGFWRLGKTNYEWEEEDEDK